MCLCFCINGKNDNFSRGKLSQKNGKNEKIPAIINKKQNFGSEGTQTFFRIHFNPPPILILQLLCA